MLNYNTEPYNRFLKPSRVEDYDYLYQTHWWFKTCSGLSAAECDQYLICEECNEDEEVQQQIEDDISRYEDYYQGSGYY